MTVRSTVIILLPMPLVILVALLTSSMQIKPAAGAVNVVDRAIKVANSTEEDLGQLGVQTGENYGALSPVQDQLTDSYTLRIGEADPLTSQTFILAEFDNGTWLNCRTMNDQLSFCYLADPPYTAGLASLINGEPPPQDCRGCPPRADEAWETWLQKRAPLLGADPRFERLGQWGGYVLMRVAAADGSYAIECRFDKMSPVQLESCWEE
jgi:hypothetical protein